MDKIVKNEKKNLKELIDVRGEINNRAIEIEIEINRTKRGIKLLKPNLKAAQDVYDALDDETAKKDLDKAHGQLADANVKLNALKVELAEGEARLLQIDKMQNGKADKILLGKYLILRQELLKLQIKSYKKSLDLSSEMKELLRSLKDNDMVNTRARLLPRLNRGLVK